MGRNNWILPTVLGGTIVLLPAADAYTHPFDAKEHEYTEVEVGYTHVGTTGNIIILPPRIDTRITPGTGSLGMEGQTPVANVGLRSA